LHTIVVVILVFGGISAAVSIVIFGFRGRPEEFTCRALVVYIPNSVVVIIEVLRAVLASVTVVIG
jgi:hypothetical protein